MRRNGKALHKCEVFASPFTHPKSDDWMEVRYRHTCPDCGQVWNVETKHGTSKATRRWPKRWQRVEIGSV